MLRYYDYGMACESRERLGGLYKRSAQCEFSVSVKSWVCSFLKKKETPVALMYFNVVLNFGNLMSDFSICCLYQAGTQQGTQR